MKRQWQYLTNPFLVATNNSYRIAARISTQHDSALKAGSADPFIMTLYTAYHTVHVAFMNAYNAWVAQGGLQTGATLNLRQLLRLLSNSKVQKWEAMAAVVYAQDTATFQGLFPRGRSPFQTGSQTDLIGAVEALIDAIGADAALATLLTDVQAFNTQLQAANTSQKGSLSQTKALSDKVDDERIKMCIAQYTDLGSLIAAYAIDPDVIAQYFDTEAIRKGQQVFFDHQVKPLKVELMVQHTFADGDEIRLENAGPVDLRVYNADNKDTKPTDAAITLKPGDKITIPASNLGPLTNAFVLAYNPNELTKGQLILEIL